MMKYTGMQKLDPAHFFIFRDRLTAALENHADA